MKRGPDRGYFPELAKSEAAKQEFAIKGLTLNFVSGSWYLGAHLGLRDQLEAWVKPKGEALSPWG